MRWRSFRVWYIVAYLKIRNAIALITNKILQEEREEPEKISWRNDSIPVRDQGRVPRQPGKETSKPTEGMILFYVISEQIAKNHLVILNY